MKPLSFVILIGFVPNHARANTETLSLVMPALSTSDCSFDSSAPGCSQGKRFLRQQDGFDDLASRTRERALRAAAVGFESINKAVEEVAGGFKAEKNELAPAVVKALGHQPNEGAQAKSQHVSEGITAKVAKVKSSALSKDELINAVRSRFGQTLEKNGITNEDLLFSDYAIKTKGVEEEVKQLPSLADRLNSLPTLSDKSVSIQMVEGEIQKGKDWANFVYDKGAMRKTGESPKSVKGTVPLKYSNSDLGREKQVYDAENFKVMTSSIIYKPAQRVEDTRFCLISSSDPTKTEFFVPKGGLNTDESIGVGTLREVIEEAGVR